MNCLLSVSIPSGGAMICAYVYSTCAIMIGDMSLYVDLLPLSIDQLIVFWEWIG